MVVNGSETEPASAKDRLLLARLPHLVLDGAVLAAAHGRRPRGHHQGRGRHTARDQGARGGRGRPRDDKIASRLVAGPEGYVTGEETAVLHFLSRGVAKPTFVPPRPYERGLGGRPTLVQNRETWRRWR